MSRDLPLVRVKAEELAIYDPRKGLACGFLYKKAGKGKLLASGRFSLRFFNLNTDIGTFDDYTLDHYEDPDDKLPKKRYPLGGAVIQYMTGSRFSLLCVDGSEIELKAEIDDAAARWINSLSKVIQVASERMNILANPEGYKNTVGTDGRPVSVGSRFITPGGTNNLDSDGQDQNRSPNTKMKETLLENGLKPLKTVGPSPFVAKELERGPLMRLDIDIHAMPPSSAQRHQFEEMFKSDLMRALTLDESEYVIEVLNIYPMPGKDWLTVVEFDIFVLLYDDDNPEENLHREERRINFLKTLLQMMRDVASPLYRGYTTCKVDGSFAKNFPSLEQDELELFSPEAGILDILKRYDNVPLPFSRYDFSFFSIMIEFEGLQRQISIPNPRIFPPKLCVLWPYEIKAALGFLNTMQDLWVEPIALVPKGLPLDMSHPIIFGHCAMLGKDITGEYPVAINASRLKAGLTYVVQVEDFREDVINTLTPQERSVIKKTFDEFDADNSGDLDRSEAEDLVRHRVAQRKADIDANFNSFLQSDYSDDDMKRADELRLMYYQQLHEAQARLVKLYAAADTNGDGRVSFTEFLLAEAWWMRCTLDPNRHLDFC